MPRLFNESIADLLPAFASAIKVLNCLAALPTFSISAPDCSAANLMPLKDSIASPVRSDSFFNSSWESITDLVIAANPTIAPVAPIAESEAVTFNAVPARPESLSWTEDIADPVRSLPTISTIVLDIMEQLF